MSERPKFLPIFHDGRRVGSLFCPGGFAISKDSEAGAEAIVTLNLHANTRVGFDDSDLVTLDPGLG